MKPTLQLDSDDYIMYDEDTEEYIDLNYDFYNEDLKYFKNTTNKLLGDNKYLLSGSAGLWSGPSEYAPQTIMGFNDFFDSMSSDIDHLICKLYKDGSVEITGTHHDGTNYYKLTPLLSLSKAYLRDLIEQNIIDNLDRDDINNFLKHSWECTISTASKPALADALINYIDL